MIIQVERMRDGKRRVVTVTEVCGMSDGIITLQDLHQYEYEGEDAEGHLLGEFISSGLRPHFTEKAEYFGLGKALMDTI
jgi:pilus assembly protein CpaF